MKTNSESNYRADWAGPVTLMSLEDLETRWAERRRVGGGSYLDTAVSRARRHNQLLTTNRLSAT